MTFDNGSVDPKNCVVTATTPGNLTAFHQCTRKRGYGPDGLYCEEHAMRLADFNHGATMTTDEALDELRRLQEIYQGPHLALVPVGNTQLWDVVNMAARQCREPYTNTIIATGLTPAAAIQAAKNKLEETQ